MTPSLTPATILQWLRDNPDEAKAHGITAEEPDVMALARERYAMAEDEWENKEAARSARLGSCDAFVRIILNHFTPLPLEKE